MIAGRIVDGLTQETMTLPDGVEKLTIFEAFEDDQDSKWKLLVVGEEYGIYLCKKLEPLWHTFIEGYERAQKQIKVGFAMELDYPADHENLGATLCAFRQFPDRLAPYLIEKGKAAYELEKQLESEKTNVAKGETNHDIQLWDTEPGLDLF